MKKIVKYLLIVVIIYLVAANAIFYLARLATDYWWFQSLGFADIFTRSLWTQVILFAVAFSFSSAFLLLNFLVATPTDPSWTVSLSRNYNQTPIVLNGRWLRKIGIFVCLLLGFLFGMGAKNSYLGVLKFLYATPFGQTDPIFGKDISFYIFSLPIYSWGLRIFRNVVVITLILCAAVYLLRGAIKLKGYFLRGKKVPRGPEEDSGESKLARRHLSLLIAFLLILFAVRIYLDIFSLLTQPSGPIIGAAFTDIAVKIPLRWLTLALALLSSVGIVCYGLGRRMTFALVPFVLYIVVAIASSIIPSFYQKYIVAPNELAMETPYIKNHLTATNQAYNLNKIEEREIAGDQSLTAQDISKNNLTFKNVRLWDRAPLLSTFAQLQEIRTYYDFASIDDDRYSINGELRQMLLSPRELNSSNLPNRTWINEHLAFTHGYGLTAAPVNEVTSEGLPELFIKDLPPQSSVKELSISRPEIYFGELSNNYAIVNTNTKEFDYPKGEENVFASYAGKGGVVLDSFLKQFLFALRFNDPQIIVSNDLTPQSRILYDRQIKERLARIAPFLDFDRDPYMVVADGKLYWLADAYSVTDHYPYSKSLPVKGGLAYINYIRNSVKVVMDAYDGSVTFYQADENDPIIKTYAKIFPGTFRPLSQMPLSLRSHLKYPEDLLMTQSWIYSTYHMKEPKVFYNKEDQWDLAFIGAGGETQEEINLGLVSPRHLVMKLPGESKEEFVFMMPFRPAGKDNLSAWLVARNDGANYGKLSVYRFPKQKLVYGPQQIIGRINQDSGISSQLNLWNQGGSRVIYGPMLIVPVEQSLIYIRPLYLKATEGKIPELKRVIVVYGEKVVMEESLNKALANIFGTEKAAPSELVKETSPSAAKIQGETPNDLINQAQSVYEKALQAQKNGDWTSYGEQMKSLGEILQKLKK